MSLTVAQLSALRAATDGAVHVPTDDDFAALRAEAIWNGAITRTPAAICRPASVEHVAAVLATARQHGLDLTVRGGGHAFAGHAVADDAVMLDLGRLAAVEVDPDAQTASCGGGARWADLDAATAAHGLAVTGGFISHTGIAGLTLGGGMGWLTRRMGLSCDNLVSAQVVTAAGQVVTASAEEEPELFWALRGGGGNFGVVTRFTFGLHPLPPLVDVGLFFWEVDQARAALRLAARHVPALPVSMGALVAGMNAPEAPFVPVELQGRPGFGVLITAWGDPDGHAAAIAPLRQLSPAFEMVAPMPYPALQQMFDDGAPWGSLAYEKALFLDALSDDVLDALMTQLPAKASPMSFIPMFPLGGAFAAVPDEDTAFGGRRSTQWVVNIAAIAMTQAEYDADRVWARSLWDALRPHSSNTGGYVNFLADEDDDRVRTSYGDKYDRLAAVKLAWDPDNVFHHNANVAPGVPGVPGPRTSGGTQRHRSGVG